MVMRIKGGDWGRIRVWNYWSPRNSKWGVWVIPLSGVKNFSHIDPKNAVIIGWVHSIWYLNVSKKLLTKLYNLWFKSLKDLQENFPEWIWIENIFEISWMLAIFENGKYKPKWGIPLELLHNHFSDSTLRIMSWWWKHETLNQIVVDPEFKTREEKLRNDARKKLNELLVSLQLISEQTE